MKTSLMTQEQYVTNLGELEKFYVNINFVSVSPQELNEKMGEVLQNLNKVSRYMVGAAINLGVAKSSIKSVTLIRDAAHNSVLLTDDVSSLKSAELRSAKCKTLILEDEKNLCQAQIHQVEADSYYLAVKTTYETLNTSVSVLKEQIKLFQNMLYIDSSSNK